MIGDGIATLERMKLQEAGYHLETDSKKHIDRLRDSVGRKSVMGILEVLEVLSQNERDAGKTLASNRILAAKFIRRVWGQRYSTGLFILAVI